MLVLNHQFCMKHTLILELINLELLLRIFVKRLFV